MDKLDYSMKEVLQILKISEGTIRNYEKKGLIQCQRNKDNQYRHFSFRELNRMFTIRKYRELGMSLDQIQKMLCCNDLSVSTELLTQHYNSTIEKAQKLLSDANKIKLDILKVEKINTYLKTFSIIKRPNYEFYEVDHIRKQNNEEIFDSYATLLKMNELGKTVHPVVGYVRLNPQPLYPNQKCLYTITRVNSRVHGLNSFSNVLLPLLSYLKTNHYTVIDNILGIKLLTIEEDQDIFDYYEAYIPVKKDETHE